MRLPVMPPVKPMLAKSVPEVPDPAAFPGGVLYEPNTAEALARALEELLGDPARRAELGRKGRESVAASFTLDTMARKMIEVYRSVVPAAVAGRGG